MNEKRLIIHHKGKEQGDYVLYWMQNAQRFEDNHALLAAILKANQLEVPLVVAIVILPNFLSATDRAYQFMFDGLRETIEKLAAYGAEVRVLKGQPLERLTKHLVKAAYLVLDHGYLRIQKDWYQNLVNVAQDLDLSTLQVETNIIVPVRVASDHEEYAARTLRPKLEKLVDDFMDLQPYPELTIKSDRVDGLSLLKERENPQARINFYLGGASRAQDKLQVFLAEKINHYEKANDPANRYYSGLSPYIHFGQISPLRIYYEVKEAMAKNPSLVVPGKAFLEQLLVRRELSINFCFYNDRYDDFQGMTSAWAYETMAHHEGDTRPYLYTLEELEQATTHDHYWNAAMKEMKLTGFMHGYMRMYWAKKIIEWTESFKEAYEWTLYLNNKYFLDGRDPNSYTGVAWCYGKHDQGWKEREVFGKLRYMNAKGLERKFNMKAYIQWVDQLSL